MGRRKLRLRALALLCPALFGVACGGSVEILPTSDASPGGGDGDQSTSAAADGPASPSSSGASGSTGGSASSGAVSPDAAAGGSSSGNSFGSCGADTCAMGCCDGTGTCNTGGGDTACGFFGAACIDCTLSGAVCVYGRCVQGNPAGVAICGGAPCDSATEDCCITSGAQLCIARGYTCLGAAFACVSTAECAPRGVCCLSQPAHGEPTAAYSGTCGASGSLLVCATDAECPAGLGTCTFGGFGAGVGFCKAP